METRTLKAGSVVKIHGIPVELKTDVEASGAFAAIDQLASEPSTGVSEKAEAQS